MVPAGEFPRFFEGVLGLLPELPKQPVAPFDEGDSEPPIWIVQAPSIEDRDLVTPIEIPEIADPPEGDFPEGGEEGRFTGGASPGVDVIAVYCDFHRHRGDWGIYFFERPFLGFVLDMARVAGATPTATTGGALRQVLFHELAHFEVEVIGTELEDALGASSTCATCPRVSARRLSGQWVLSTRPWRLGERSRLPGANGRAQWLNPEAFSARRS